MALTPARQVYAQAVTSITPYFPINPAYSGNITRPTVADDGARIDCDVSSTTQQVANCQPLNRAFCESQKKLPLKIRFNGIQQTPTYGQATTPPSVANGTTLPITITIAKGGACPSPPSSQGSDVPTQTDSVTYNSTQPSALVAYVGSALVYEIGNGTSVFGDLDTDYLLRKQANNWCQDSNGTPLDQGRIRVCVYVNVSSAGGNTGTTTGTPTYLTTYAEFLVDTKDPPAAQGLTTKGLNGRIEATVALPSDPDIARVEVRSSQHPDDLANSDCATWQHAESTLSSTFASPQSSATVTVTAANGTTYALCARTLDRTANTSAFTAVQQAQAVAECDFFGCYPEVIDVGFCGQGLMGPQGAVWALFIHGVHRLSRRRRHG